MRKLSYLFLCILCLLPALAFAQTKAISISMDEYEYPYPVEYMPLQIEGQDLRMAYMDVKPSGKPNGRSVLLLHGKNFFGAYWKETIRFLTDNGFRVIVPDQIGFGKSSKPAIHYSFHLLATNTRKLLDKLNIEKVAVVGHSMGGMVATRFALLYPERVSEFVLEDPIGLEDYRIYVPYVSLEDEYQAELKQTEEKIRNYQKGYYVHWQPAYEEYVRVAAGWLLSAEYPRAAMAAALTYEMIYEQPVCYEFGYIKARALVVVGLNDRTVVGKALVSKEDLDKVGQYPELGKKTAGQIKGAELVEIDNCGHIPHLEATEKFHQALLTFLNKK